MADIPNHLQSASSQSKAHQYNHANLKPYQIEIQHTQIHVQNQLPNKNITGSSKISRYGEDRDQDRQKQKEKNSKYYSSANVPGNASGVLNMVSPKTDNNFKNIPSFLENRNAMKGSMIAPELETLVKIKYEPNSGACQIQTNSKTLRIPDLNQDMKYSSIELGGAGGNEGYKIPSFLNKDKKSSLAERPESSRDGSNSRQPSDVTLASSYGNHKKIRQQKVDPAEEWVKKSMSKKKDKAMTINNFYQLKELGSGKYGKVFLARQKHTGFICALKILEKELIVQQEITEQLIRELKIQTFLNHTNIIKMYGFFDDAKNIYLIMEAATGGQLFKQLKKHQSMPEAKVAAIMRQVCQALSELHSYRIIHRDIKPENIVLHDNLIKLCDFGWSVYCDSALRTTFCGTPLYVGPEILKGNEYDEKIDIWSLGVMMYEMMVGENPFKITKEEELIKIIKDEIKIPTYVDISPEGRDFLFACLQKNPDDRLSIRQLVYHKFFQKYPDKGDKKLAMES